MMLSRQYLNRVVAQRSMMQMPFRGIKLHEYQAGNLLHKFNVQIPLGSVAFTPEEAEAAAKTMPAGCVVKSQVLGGGRGLGHFKETGF